MNKAAAAQMIKKTANGVARQAALNATSDLWINPSGVVSYQSKGMVLVIASSIDKCQQISPHLDNALTLKYLITAGSQGAANDCFYGSVVKIDGHLGGFDISIIGDNGKQTSLTVDAKAQKFDIIIDLSSAPLIDKEAPPFGYYFIQQNPPPKSLFAEINTLIGILDKPKFVQLDSTICVHSRNKTQACTRCLEVCPAEAIISNGDSAQINPNLCHGFGSCANVCPTGAISYHYPSHADLMKKMQTLLQTYQQAGGKDALILFYAQADFAQHVQPFLSVLEERILPLAVEEIGVLGLDSFLYALGCGVQQIAILSIRAKTKVKNELKHQISLTQSILKSLGYSRFCLNLTEQATSLKSSDFPPLSAYIGLLDVENKRNRLWATIDFLYQHQQTQQHPEQCTFSSDTDVLFGEIIVDKAACTLCMACSAICPMNALLSASDDRPTLTFNEQLCVQCGLCAKSCPEDAIQLAPRLLFNQEKRQQPRILNEDQPFRCSQCNKVFASAQLIAKMIKQLKSHSMFQGDNLSHLRMCEDCRVKALFAKELR